jgi:hypothetical protein
MCIGSTLRTFFAFPTACGCPPSPTPSFVARLLPLFSTSDQTTLDGGLATMTQLRVSNFAPPWATLVHLRVRLHALSLLTLRARGSAHGPPPQALIRNAHDPSTSSKNNWATDRLMYWSNWSDGVAATSFQSRQDLFLPEQILHLLPVSFHEPISDCSKVLQTIGQLERPQWIFVNFFYTNKLMPPTSLPP